MAGVILENDDFNKYEELLARFKTALDDYNRHAGPDSRISIARGIAIYEENVDLTVSDVFKRADDAMYQNKMQVKKQKETTDRNATPAINQMAVQTVVRMTVRMVIQITVQITVQTGIQGIG